MEEPKEEDELPENLEGLLNNIPFFMPDEADEETMLVLKRGAKGLCCMCTGALGKNTLVVIGADGVRMVFCSGACMTDQSVVGFLSQTYEDIVEQVKFRGGAIDADGPEEAT